MLSGHRETNTESYVPQPDNSRLCKVPSKSYPIELNGQSHNDLSSEENYNDGIDEQSKASEGGLANLPRDTPVRDLIFGCGIGSPSLGDEPTQSGLFTQREATELGGLPYRKIATTGYSLEKPARVKAGYRHSEPLPRLFNHENSKGPQMEVGGA